MSTIKVNRLENTATTDGGIDIDSSGNCGVGTSSPNSLLDCAGGNITLTEDTNLIFKNSARSTNRGAIQFTSGGEFRVRYGSLLAEGMRIDSSGRVLVGSSTVQAHANMDDLQVGDGSGNRGITISSGTSNYGTLAFGDSTDASGVDRYAGAIEYYHSNNSMAFLTSSTSRMTLDSSGRVHIGDRTNSNATHFGTASVNISKTDDIVTSFNKAACYLQIGNAESTINGLYPIGFGFTVNTSTQVPAYIAYKTINSSGAEYGDLLFATRNVVTDTAPTERMRIDSSGRLLMGATAAVSGADANGKVQVSQDVGSNTCILVAENTASSGNLSCIRARLRNSAPNSVFSAFLQCDDSAANRLTLRSNGGLANYSANNANLSDRNAKKDISAAAGTWDRVKEWEIVNYRYKDQPDDADLNLGVIAQQVNESCPEVVTVFQEAKEATETEPAQEERLGVKEQQMHWMAIKALQEAIAKIETLEARLTTLEAG